MKIPPTFRITPKILETVAKIEANKIYFHSISIPQPLMEKIQRISLLKSSLFSARIEGNPLTMQNLGITPDKPRKKEVFNILNALKFIDKNIKPGQDITKDAILSLHKIAMKDLLTSCGHFRKEVGAIFNQAGVAVYISPSPKEVPLLVEKLLRYANSGDDKFPLVTSFIAHLIFEKIHPFIDGNGRVGRLFIFSILKAKNWNFPLFIPLEEYLDEHKTDYYYYLDVGTKMTEDYVSFMLQGFFAQTEKVKGEILAQIKKKETILLPPRQEEIYLIIKDHGVVSFNFISRRFLKVPKRTLRYDLKKLQEKKLVVKIGETRGAYYKVKA